MKPVSSDHPLFALFSELVAGSLSERGIPADPGVDSYLTKLLLRFMHSDEVFALKRGGRPVESVIEMAAEGDVRLNAESFERERQVHQHIGDYILFWSGLYPDYLRRLRLSTGYDLVCDYSVQGRESYYIVSTFEHPPFGEEAPTFRVLSEGFPEYSLALADVAERLPYPA
jgi:hypothetical protein